MSIQLHRRQFIAATAGLALAGRETRAVASESAASVYDRSIVIDGLGGPGGFDTAARPGDPLAERFLADARRSGITAINYTVSAVGNVPTAFEDTVAAIAAANREIADHPDVFIQVRTAADLLTAKRSNRVGLIYGIQDTAPLGTDIARRLPILQNLGVRIVQMTYNRRNLAGDGSLEPANGGLSNFGREIIAALNERRILVDLSHGGQRVHADGITASRRPPAITHTGCRNLVDNPRNTWDADLKALADKGGVAGIYFVPFLRAKGELRSEDIIRHIEHAIKVAGEDHVGIGTDGYVSRIEVTPEYQRYHRQFVSSRREAGISAPGEDPDVLMFSPDYNEPRRLEKLAHDLFRRGHSTGRVEKILGMNFARLFKEVWG
ncbi:MAG: membrane dipeptidase [Pseudomonadota bacterium]|nr:membrane dipeptidase [Pseudomonadota bacterium]